MAEKHGDVPIHLEHPFETVFVVFQFQVLLETRFCLTLNTLIFSHNERQLLFTNPTQSVGLPQSAMTLQTSQQFACYSYFILHYSSAF